MLLSQALDIVHNFTPQEFSGLSDLLSPELIDECLADTGTVTLRKRRLSMEMMVWAVTGMALFRSHSMTQLVSHLDILLPGKKALCCAQRGCAGPTAIWRRCYPVNV